MNGKRRYVVIAIIFGSLFVGIIATELILSLTGVAKDVPILMSVFIFAAPAFSVFGTLLFFRYLTIVNEAKQLINENLYNFGEAIEFFDQHAFEEKVSIISKSKRAREAEGQFILAFTASNLISMQNLDRDENYSAFNASTAKLLDDLFVKKRRTSKREYAFCFNHGIFYVYLYANDNRVVMDVANEIIEGLFKIEQPGITSVSVSPFFGVAKLDKNTPIVETIENASIARNVSERNFETITFYSDSFRKRSTRSEIQEITDALKDNEFVVYYQPKFNLGLRKFVSSEALIRWDSKKHGLLSPAKFIPLAEDAGLIHEIDTFVFKKVCEDLNEAKRRGRRLIPVSVNFSLYEFYSTEFLDTILKMLDEYKISPEYIEIEITEATSQANTFSSVSIIKKLRERGIRVLMDDFGVGFSNIGNLRKIPFDAVKIDKSFIDDIATDDKSRAIVKFLIELCQANEMEVIAEGVDNKEQNEILRKFKCNTIQGFYYSKALPIKEYEKFLMNNPFEKKEASK